MPFKDPIKMKEWRQGWYQKEKARNLKIMEEAKESGCMDCAVNDPRVLEFHHRPGEVKRYTIGRMYRHTEQDLREEMAKCDILCANCHIIRHKEAA